VDSRVFSVEILDTDGDPSMKYLRGHWCRMGNAFIIVLAPPRESPSAVFYYSQKNQGASPCRVSPSSGRNGSRSQPRNIIQGRSREGKAAWCRILSPLGKTRLRACDSSTCGLCLALEAVLRYLCFPKKAYIGACYVHSFELSSNTSCIDRRCGRWTFDFSW
jgi:hypothetical protein